MSTQTVPTPAPTQTGPVELHHRVCSWDCDDDLALCGTDVTDEPWGDSGDECVVCADLDQLDRCLSTTCPGRAA